MEAKVVGQGNQARHTDSSQDQLPGEGQYADLKRQFEVDDHTLALRHLAALNAWDRLKNQEKGLNPFLKLYTAQKKLLVIFL